MIVLGLLMASSICVEGQNYYNNHVSISIQTFYNELAPYGEWIYTPEYGYAWSPYLDYNEDFRPYATRGNWVYTDLGWTWVSEYRWGWATFHYGRWFFDDYFGWMWIPGYEWAPAWVTWGSYNDYWAWAPMGPNMYVNVNYSWRPPSFWWTFVPFRHFCAYNWYSYIYDRPVQVTNITYINNYYSGNDDRHNTWTWDYGPRVPDVERHAQTKVQKRTLVDSDKPAINTVRDNNLTVYRPGVTQKQENSKPANFRTVDQVKFNSGTVDNNRTNVRTEPVNQQKTETTTKQYGEPRVQPPSSTRDTRGNYNTGSQNKQTERSTPTRVEPTRKETETRTNSRETTTPPNTKKQTGTTTPSPTKPKPVTKESPETKTTPPKEKSK